MQTFSSSAQRRLDILSPFGDERPHSQVLKASWLETPLGEMLAIADDKALFLLEFVDWKGLERAVAKLCTQTLATVVSGRTLPIQSIEQELKAYFEGRLKDFETPLQLCGTPFQKQVWKVLRQVPYGETQSYTAQAIAVGNPLAFRAVANANATNPIALVIPCHRIINRNGQLGGYGGGIDRKKWLLQHEQHHCDTARVLSKAF